MDVTELILIFFIGAIMWLSFEVIVATLIYKKVAGRWWWSKQKESWHFGFGANSWEFSGAGLNPFDTLKKFWSDITGENQGFKEIVKEEIRNEIRKRARNSIKKTLSTKMIAKKAGKLILKAISDELRDE